MGYRIFDGLAQDLPRRYHEVYHTPDPHCLTVSLLSRPTSRYTFQPI
jgi:hypothetical protein